MALLWLPLAAAPAGLYHRIRNAKHRGELVELCNELGLVRNAAEIGVHRGHFSHHNLKLWRGSKYYMIDSWTFRKNDTLPNGLISGDKNERSMLRHNRDHQHALAAVKEWTASGRAIVMRRFAEAAVHEFEDGFFDFIYIYAGHEYQNVHRDLRTWWPKLRAGGMLAGDDFADLHDTYPGLPIPPGDKHPTHRTFQWGVKSAVANFSATVGSPFFLTFADRHHPDEPLGPISRAEWEEDAEEVRQLTKAGGIPSAVRANKMHPAWYLFK